jgi:hypothetical protein
MRKTARLLAHALILVLAITAVAVPATAWAQSAGDEQYVDPFQDPGEAGDDGGGNNSQGGGGGDQGSAPADEQVAQAPADAGDTAGTTAGESSGTTLPQTGLMLGGVALTGVLLLGGGIALRRLWPPRN